MKRTALLLLAGLCAMVLVQRQADAHCQVPCGIYDDHARIHQIYEDITTIRKAVKRINRWSNKKVKSAQTRNQLIRWVFNKEKHAENIIRIVSDYFLTQKLKPKKKGKAAKAYIGKLIRLHAVMKAAMKTKQSANPKYVDALKRAVDAIAGDWSKKK